MNHKDLAQASGCLVTRKLPSQTTNDICCSRREGASTLDPKPSEGRDGEEACYQSFSRLWDAKLQASIRSHTASNKPGTDTTASGTVLAKESDEPLKIDDLWTSPILVAVQERHARQGLVIDDVAQGRGPEDFCEEINHTLPESRTRQKTSLCAEYFVPLATWRGCSTENGEKPRLSYFTSSSPKKP